MKFSVIVAALSTTLSSAQRSLLRNLAESSDIPSNLNEDVMIKVGDPYAPGDSSTTPLFFHIPKAGGTTIHDLTAFCLRLVTASEVGITQGHEHDATIGEFSLDYGATFVNVDTTTKKGLKRAHDLGFAQAELADVIFTGYIPQASHTLFDKDHKAFMFGIFRDPSERAISLFYYLQDATWEETYHPGWKDMTLNEYLKSPYAENDWVTRNLVGKYAGELNVDDLAKAKEIVSTRMLVGLLTEMDESVNRFGAAYGWNQLDNWEACIDTSKSHHGSNKHKHPEVDPKSETWQLLLATNPYDLQLYALAVAVFEQQRQLFADIEVSS
mmetsp:Transcript_25301/g.42040  ORF Transcript_25301/g.42040 Transcript_25301/m.42040 type:complete len:326 (+) Transcript_25301:45-1022(+)